MLRRAGFIAVSLFVILACTNDDCGSRGDGFGAGENPVELTYEVPTCTPVGGPDSCDWSGPTASTLEPYPDNRSGKLPVTACAGAGSDLKCTKTAGGGFATIASGLVPYSSQYLTVPVSVNGIEDRAFKDGSDVSCYASIDETGCGRAVLNEYNCERQDGRVDVDVLGVQGDANSGNYVAGGDWPKISSNSQRYSTYECVQTGTVNGETDVCITRQYPTITHGAYGDIPAEDDPKWPVPSNPNSGSCKNGLWADMTTTSSGTLIPTEAILQRELNYFTYYKSNPPAFGNPNYGPLIDLPANKYKDENGNPLTQAVLSVGHGVMDDLCGDLTLLSNGPRAILQMNIGTRSWSLESNSGAYLDYDPSVQGMHQKLYDEAGAVSSQCSNSAGHGIQPWVQRYDWSDFPSS